jgi:hypothetical protein
MNDLNKQHGAWTPQPARIPVAWRRQPEQTASVFLKSLLRNAIPFAGILGFGWPVQDVLWLSAFNFLIQVAVIAIASAVAPRLQHIGKRQLIARSFWFALLSVLVAGATLCLIGLAYLPVVRVLYESGMFAHIQKSLWCWVAGLAISAIPAFLAEVRVEIDLSRLGSLEENNNPFRVMGEVGRPALIIIFCPIAIALGDVWVAFAICLFTAISVVHDVWPDILRNIVRSSRRTRK